MDDAPWGFAPSHYGRWTQIGPRWAWVPGSFGPRPVYAPALVAFVGGDNWSVALGSPGAAWFPLAPGEYWRPHYHASDRYHRGLNWGRERVRPPADGYHFHRRPNAVTYAPADQFGGGQRGRRPGFGDGSRLPSGALNDSRIVAPPPRADMKSNMEDLIHHFKLFSEGIHVPEGQVYSAIEHPKGEFGIYAISDGANKPYRLKIRSPSYVHLSAMGELVRGHMIADVVTMMGTIDIVFGEINR